MEEIYKQRREDLLALVKKLGRGSIARISREADIDASYLSRCLYEPPKKGYKNIGDEIVVKLDNKFPEWRGAKQNEKIIYTSPNVIYVKTPPPPTVIEELVIIVGSISNDGVKALMSYAYHVEKEHPAQAKQTPESSA